MFGLRTLLGRPIVAVSAYDKILDGNQAAAVGRFLTFLRLGLNPKLDTANRAGQDASSLCFANTFLQESEKEALLSPNVDFRHERPWLGTARNEFEVARVRKAFRDRYLPRLVAKAPKLPIELALVKKVELDGYDEKRGGFPMNGISLRNQFHLPLSPCSARDRTVEELKVAAPLPMLWKIDPQHGEKVVAAMPVDRMASSFGQTHRTAYEAVIFSLDDVPRAGLSAKVESVMLYRDKAMTQLLYTFAIDLPKPAVLQSGLPAKIPQYGTLDVEAVDLLLLRDNGDVLDDDAWQMLSSRQLRNDKAYYARAASVSSRRAAAAQNGPTFPPNYVPFFPDGFTPAPSMHIDGSVMASFKKWSVARAKVLPRVLRLSGGFPFSPLGPPVHDHPLSFGRDVDRRDDATTIAALVSRGYSSGQLVWPDFDDGSTSRFDPRYTAGLDKKRIPILALAKDAKIYQLDLSRNPTAFAGQRGSGRYPTDIDLRVDRTELVPLDARNEIFVIFVTPVAARVKSVDGSKRQLLFEQTFVASPPQAPAQAQVVTTAPPMPLVFGPEVADLLVIKHHPDFADDKFYWNMLLARRTYERQSAHPAYGRFFTPLQATSAKPDVSLLRPLLPRFEKWTRDRAAALPDKMAVEEIDHVSTGQLQIGNCLSDPDAFGHAMRRSR